MHMGNLRTDAIREAVAAGEFTRATVLWNEYAAGIREAISLGKCAAARIAEARELVEWSSGVVLCDCAHDRDQLNRLWVASRYDNG